MSDISRPFYPETEANQIIREQDDMLVSTYDQIDALTGDLWHAQGLARVLDSGLFDQVEEAFHVAQMRHAVTTAAMERLDKLYVAMEDLSKELLHKTENARIVRNQRNRQAL